MEPLKSIAERYWVVYYLVYVGGVAFGALRYHPLREQGKDELYALVAVFAFAAGLALLTAMLLEVIGKMVLLIPATWKKIKEQGVKEGREKERQRIIDALAKAGIWSGDSGAALTAAEIRRIVRGGSDYRP